MENYSSHEEENVSRLQDAIPPIASAQMEVVVPKFAQGKFELPQPAHKYLPTWYEEAGTHDSPDSPLDKSVRDCMPFMEALTLGWIIPVPTDIAITRGADGIKVGWGSDNFNAMGAHDVAILGGDEFPHDGDILKFNLPYTLRTPEGVSTLFMPPLNRMETPITPFSGVVDTDKYVNQTNIPAMMHDTGFAGIIEAGTPLAQAIPFRRDSLVKESQARSATDKEEELMDRESDAARAVDAYYKREVWEPKKASREAGGCPFGFGDDE